MFYNESTKTEHVKNLHKVGEIVYWSYDGNNYRTDTYGRGIYKLINSKIFLEWESVTGTSQFSLRGMSMSGIRKKLNRYFNAGTYGDRK